MAFELKDFNLDQFSKAATQAGKTVDEVYAALNKSKAAIGAPQQIAAPNLRPFDPIPLQQLLQPLLGSLYGGVSPGRSLFGGGLFGRQQR
jgi:hypothetical protein